MTRPMLADFLLGSRTPEHQSGWWSGSSRPNKLGRWGSLAPKPLRAQSCSMNVTTIDASRPEPFGSVPVLGHGRYEIAGPAELRASLACR